MFRILSRMLPVYSIKSRETVNLNLKSLESHHYCRRCYYRRRYCHRTPSILSPTVARHRR